MQCYNKEYTAVCTGLHLQDYRVSQSRKTESEHPKWLRPQAFYQKPLWGNNKQDHVTEPTLHSLSSILKVEAEFSSETSVLNYKTTRCQKAGKLKKKKNKHLGFSPQANYTDRATAACRRS
jgi:hypothetical protein